MKRLAPFAAFSLFGIFLCLTAPAHADFKTGTAAYKRGDYKTALRELKPFAEEGNAVAQLTLGMMYIKGRGVPQDDTQAVNWFRKAAEQGNALAQYNLGLMYGNGRGVKRDYGAAYMWLSLGEPRLPTGKLRDVSKNLRILAARNLSSEKLLEARRRVREWKPGGP